MGFYFTCNVQEVISDAAPIYKHISKEICRL